MNTDDIEILLIEDNPSDVKLTRHAFEKNKLVNRIQVVIDGAEALEFLFGTGRYAGRNVCDAPRLVLLDLKLPKMDGLEVLRRIRSDPRTSLIPVVVLTSSNEEQDIVETYRLGVNSYIRKPVDFEKFTEVARILGLYWLLLNVPPVRAGREPAPKPLR